MRPSRLFLAAALFLAPAASAAPVYMLTSGDAALDQLFITRLTEGGHTVAVGPAWHLLNSGADFPQGGSILLLANANWNSGASMSAAGQAAIMAYVLQGGGLVTTEWTLYRNATGAPVYAFGSLTPAFPVVPTNSVWRTSASVTYSRIDFDPVISAGVPAVFSFTPDNFSGTESRLTPRATAFEFYRSEGYGAGVVGWSFGNGRTLSFSTCVGTQQLNTPEFARLLANVLTWTSSAPGCVADTDDGTFSGTRDGAVTVDDLLFYLAAYADGSPRGDIDDGSATGTRDGGVTIDDLLYYLFRFENGC